MLERFHLTASADNIDGFVQHSYDDVIDFLKYFLNLINLQNSKAYVSFSKENVGVLLTQNLLNDSNAKFLFDASAQDVLKKYFFMTPVASNALSWGSFYETNSQLLKQVEVELSTLVSKKNKIPTWVIDGNDSEWVSSLKNGGSKIDSRLLGLSFKDDIDYQLTERGLDTVIRISLANYRAKFILRGEIPTEIGDFCKVFPPWFNRLKIKALGFSPRTTNALNAFGINRVFELHEIPNKDFLKIPNMGFASFNELLTTLTNLLDNFLMSLGLVVTSIYMHEENSIWPLKYLNEKQEVSTIEPEDESFLVPGNSKTWLRDFIINHPQFEGELLSFNIVDDIQYQENESKLQNDLRMFLASSRLNFLFGVLKLSDIRDYVRLFPPWVNRAPIDRLNLTVRSLNCLTGVGYKSIADLIKKDNSQLLKIENFGKGSLKDITKALNEVCDGINLQDGLFQKIFLEEASVNLSSVVNEFNYPPSESSQTLQSLVLVKIIADTIEGLDNPQAKSVLSLRLGLEKHPETLQEIADQIGVTRERVRQIESKAKAKFLNKFIIDVELERRLNHIRDGMFLPLTIESLSIYDEWFLGIEEKPWLLDALFTMFNIGNYRVHDFQGQKIVAPGERGFIEDTLRLIKEYVKVSTQKHITKTDLLKIVQDFVGIVTPELVDLIFYETCQNYVFAKEFNDERIIAQGSGLAVHILAILEESNVPLKVDELQKICIQRFSLDVSIEYVRNQSSQVAFLYAPSTFGTVKHLGLLPVEIDRVISEVLEIMSTQVSGRQWHCHELLEVLGDKIPVLLAKLDKHKLAICLSLSNKFQNLGRMVFSLPAEDGSVTTRRIDFYKFVEAVLERSDKPMHSDEIMGIIRKERGLSEFSQIFNTGRLLSVDTATWALQDKHLGITDEKFKKIVNEIYEILTISDFGLSHDELVSRINSDMSSFEFKENPHLLFSIATKSKLCKKIDIFIYIAEWGSCRRVTMKQSIFDALVDVSLKGSFAAKDVWELAVEKYKNKIPRLCINKEITDAGAVYDKDNNYWTFKQ